MELIYEFKPYHNISITLWKKARQKISLLSVQVQTVKKMAAKSWQNHFQKR